MSQYGSKFDFKINVGHSDLLIFHGPVILHYILKSIPCLNILFDYELVWPKV